MEAFLAPLYKRNVMSGALGGELAGDLKAQDRRNPIRRIEVKRRAGGQKVLRQWLAQGDAHALIIDPGFGDQPLVIMEAATLKLMLLLLLEVIEKRSPRTCDVIA